MQYVNVDDQFVADILKANKILKEEVDLNESAEVIVEESEEVHACPLCESELDEPISEQSMQECIDFVVATLQEAAELEGEMLSEADDEEDEEDADEEDDDEEDDDEEDED